MNHNNILREFVQSRLWTIVKEVLLHKAGLSYCWLLNKDEEFIFREEEDKPYCRLIKGTPLGKEECQKNLQSFLSEVKETKNPTVYTCHAGFLGFVCPLFVKEEITGFIGGCQVIDSTVKEEHYKEISKKFSLDYNIVSNSINNAISISLTSLELDIELIFDLAHLYFDSIITHQELFLKDEELKSITEFYQLFEDSRKLLLTLETDKLYSLIVKLTAKAMNAEICSLMIIDQKTQNIDIKEAIGMNKETMSKTHLKIGKGIVGHVAKTGEPLLVKDITVDSRFHVQENSPRYYTKSLISAPMKIDDKIIGIINVNNMKTRKPFTDKDLKLLSIICGHAAIAIKNAEQFHSKEKKETTDEDIKLEQKEMNKIVQEKHSLFEEKVKIEQQLEKKEEWINLKEEIIRVKQKLIQEKEKVVGEEETVLALKREMNQLEKEREQLLKERMDLLKRIQSTEVLIKEKEKLEEEKEQLIQEKEELTAQTEELGILYSISRETPLMSLPQEILIWVLSKTQHFFNFHAGAYLLLDNDRLLSEIKQVCYINEECIRDIKTRLENEWIKIAGPEKMKNIFYLTQEGKTGDMFWIGVESFQSHLIAPLSYQGEIIGLLSVNSFNEQAFTPLQRRVLTIVANQISTTLEKVRLFAKVKDLAERDELTKIYNYRYLEEYLIKEFIFASQYKKHLSYVMLDFDRLKYVNDTYGHPAGNKLIKTISDIIKETVKDKGLVARFGGDEFSVVLPETDQNNAFVMAEDIRANIAKRSIEFEKGNPHHLSASLGVATYPNQGIDTEKDLMAKADKALYEAKQRGKNCVVAYQP